MDFFNGKKMRFIKKNEAFIQRIKKPVLLVMTLGCSLLLINEGDAEPSVNDVLSDIKEPANIQYDASFIHGAAIDVSQFAEGNPVLAGTYSVDVIVNNQNRGKHVIAFRNLNGESQARACLTKENLTSLGIKSSGDSLSSQEGCVDLEKFIKHSRVYFNQGDLEVDITVPQYNLVKYERGYIDPSRWDAGSTVGILDYNVNYYTNHADTYGNDTGNLNLTAGINAGDWRFRKRINTSWNRKYGTHTDSLYGYAATDITSLKSQLTLGDINTPSDIFDTIGFRGVVLQSDDRMLPEGLRSYTPVISGIAETNAKVTLTQAGKVIYETIVPPGPFELTDVGTMGYGGDLQMIIRESNGQERTRIIPFSAPPMLLHYGVSQFSLAAGEANDPQLRVNPSVLQGGYHYGIANNYTLYGGALLSEHYQSAAIGNAINTTVGGFSFGITHAHSILKHDKRAVGNSYDISYSKYLNQTNTNMQLAAYRYSSDGFYTLRDASINRYGTHSQYYNYHARQKLSLSLSQTLWNNSSVSFSGAMYDYWSGAPRSQQYSLSFNDSFKRVSYSVTLMKDYYSKNRSQNSIMLSFFVPLSPGITHDTGFNSIYSTYTHSGSNNDALQVNASGNYGEQSELAYGIGASAAKYEDADSRETLSGNLSYKASAGQVGMTAYADNRSLQQLSFSANGSVVAHRGGVTLGPQLGDSAFAIVDVPGGKGARVVNGDGARIDRFGYAVVPSLTPYRENDISINNKDLPDTVDILQGVNTVVPRAGAAVSVNMKTIVGNPVVLIVRDQSNDYMPIGTEIINEQGEVKTVIGQGGMAFIRGWDPEQTKLLVKATSAQAQCRILIMSKQASATGHVIKNSGIQQWEVKCIPQ
ncbi:fimbria/pilus outer membrane usher protein [Erwinia amylovora]